MEGLYILSVVAMTAGVVGLAFKISRYIYLCLKTNQRVVIEADQYEVNAVRQFNPLEQADEPTPKITNKPKPLDDTPGSEPTTKHIWTIARRLTHFGTNRQKPSGLPPDNPPMSEPIDQIPSGHHNPS